jgi:alpha,alpha-trehalase
MVDDIYNETNDKQCLEKAVKILEKEYYFWETNRKTAIGLNQYSCNKSAAIAEEKYLGFIDRICKRPEGHSDADLSCQYITICESGWDITHRWGFETENYVQVELNALLYALEANLAKFYRILNIEGAEKWDVKAENRKALMEKYMLKDGIFNDYNFKKGEISKTFSTACYYPLFIGMVSEEQAKALVENLHRLETDYGVMATEYQATDYTYQWQAPNGWAPQQNIVIRGLDKYGYKDEAKRIAKKYAHLVEKNYEENHNLWEKYNVVTGSIDVTDESSERHAELPPMLGWSAAVYLEAKKFSEEN